MIDYEKIIDNNENIIDELKSIVKDCYSNI